MYSGRGIGKKGFTTVMSNGLLMNERVLDEFEKRGIKPEFNMSFDGIGCHDWLRGIPGPVAG